MNKNKQRNSNETKKKKKKFGVLDIACLHALIKYILIIMHTEFLPYGFREPGLILSMWYFVYSPCIQVGFFLGLPVFPHLPKIC